MLKVTENSWQYRCGYCSLSTRDRQVGSLRDDGRAGKVNRYNQRGQLAQTIKQETLDKKL